MNYGELVGLVSDEPVFASALLLAGRPPAGAVQRQLSRWVETGRLLQVRRGWYVLPTAFRKSEPHPFLVANRIKPASYVSLQSALAHHGLIPEFVPVVTSVTTGRPELVRTPLGAFQYRHLTHAWFTGFERVEMQTGQPAYLARPEKALLDLLYLTPDSANEAFLEELRLQHTERFNMATMSGMAQKLGSKKVCCAVERLAALWAREAIT